MKFYRVILMQLCFKESLDTSDIDSNGDEGHKIQS